MNKQEYQNMLLKLTEPLKPRYSEYKAKINLSGHAAWYNNASIDCETFARPLWGLVPFWAGGGQDKEFEEIYKTGLANGVNPSCPEYWGICGERDQRFVEMAAIAYAMLMCPEKIWQPLSDTAKDNLCAWLMQINDHEVCDSNWIFFRIMVNTALKECGRDYSKARILADLARIDDFYLGDGWYKDGIEGQKDYYIAFAIHFYSLIFAKFEEKDYPEYAKKFRQRAEIFGKDFIYWFAENGEALPYGRSLTYRFAQVSFWSACVLTGVYPFSVGVMKGIIERNLKIWLGSEMLDNAGILSVGYKYPNLLMAEHYNAPGSPYWGLKAFAILALDDNDDFWSADAEPLPKLDAIYPIYNADMIISRRDGDVTAYVAGTHKNFACGQIIPKYLKFAYSTRFGFSVARSGVSVEEAAPDSSLCFVVDDMALQRRRTKSYEVEEDRITIEWSPLTGIDVKTEIIPTSCGHNRIHTIQSEYMCAAYDCGFSVASSDCDKCETMTEVSGATAKNTFSSCTVIGGEGVIISASPNTNVLYKKTVIPAVKHIIPKGTTRIETTVIVQRPKEDGHA